MSAHKAKSEFKKVVKGRNFMTPRVLRYGKTGRYYYEISEGEGMDNQAIFGVTVVDGERKEHMHKLGDIFYTLDDVENYVRELKKH